MKQIKTDLYESLTPRQRVIATIEAEARGDSEEVQKLVKTCPKKTYRESDAEYSDRMQAIYCMTLAIECERRGAGLLFMLAAKFEKYDAASAFLQNLSDIEEAWRKTLEGLGIKPETMARFIPESFRMLDCLEDLLPEPDAENVEILQEHMSSYFNR